jgi:cytochrome c biogenesis protein CcmG/thiol:disulfide interchange protein DsbE
LTEVPDAPASADTSIASEPRPPIEPPPRGRNPVFRLLQILALAAVAGLLALFVWRIVDQGGGSALVGKVAAGKEPPAPGFDLPVLWPHAETWPAALRGALADGRIRLGELRGHPVVINFWASWCVPCKAEAPRLTASAIAYAGRVAFLGIDVQDFSGDARRFLRRFRTNYVSVRDGGSSTYSHYGLTGVPETYYVDAGGRIVAHSVGEVSSEELEQGVARAVASR